METRRIASTSNVFESWAFEAWEMMGGEIDWTAIPLICDLKGIDDPEQLIDDLLTIRLHVRRMSE